MLNYTLSVGTPGLSAYMDAVVNHGFVGNWAAWVESLRGPAMTFDDLTDEQKLFLMLTWDKLTDEQKLELKGDPFLYQDFTQEQLNEITGPAGATPEKGIDYFDGETGADGAKGDTGDQGIQGIQGLPGAKGDTGSTGAKGDTGDQGIQGIQGLPGAKGDTGDQGIQGIQGLPGSKGDTGDQGIQGIQGLPGAKGDTGDQGIQGLKGDTGATGANGFSPLNQHAPDSDTTIQAGCFQYVPDYFEVADGHLLEVADAATFEVG